MVKFILIVFICFSVLLGQELQQTEDACQSPLIIKANKEGMRSIKVTELPQFVIDLWKCRKEKNSKKLFKRINEKTYMEDYKMSQQFVGFTATCAYCSAASVLIFYLVKLSGN